MSRLMFLFLFGAACCAHAQKVLIIGIDGTIPSALTAARTPNLDRLKTSGCYSWRAVTHPVTHSAACWTSMFTGVWGDKHGVNDPGNSFAGNRLSEFPSFFRHLEDSNPALETVCLARWSPLLTVVPEADVKQSFGSDSAITAETCRRLTNSNPDVFYTILLDVDSAGHSYGWGAEVPHYVQAIETADARVGEMIYALEHRPNFATENWLVIVLSDHGQHDHPDPERSRITFHILSGGAAAKGVIWPAPSIVDLCTTVLTHMRVPIKPEWNLDARAEGLAAERSYFGTNLIFNGDAEANSGADDLRTNRGIAWWTDLGAATLGVYGSNPSWPSSEANGPESKGNNFFAGGTTNSMVTQRIDLSPIAAVLDAGVAEYVVSGWFGAQGVEEDQAWLAVTFLDSAGNLIASKRIGDVTEAERHGLTSLVRREAIGTVPAGCRFVEFALGFSQSGPLNDAFADALSFVLNERSPRPIMENLLSSPAGFQASVNPSASGYRYTLQRSVDLIAWQDVIPDGIGTGGPLTLRDTNAPADSGFYRLQVTKITAFR